MLLSRRHLLAGAVAAALPFPAAAQARRVTVAMPNLQPALDPVRDISLVAARIDESVLEGLTRVDFTDNFRIVARLATAWRRLSPTVTEFTLKEGVRFHDGSELTAEDVAFSFGPERVLGENAPGRAFFRIHFPAFERAEIVDRRTVRLVTARPDPLLLARLAGWAGQIISARAYQAASSRQEWDRAPVGTGPYRVAEYAADRHVLLRAHDAFHGGTPPAAEIQFRVMPELAARAAALAAGEVDIVTELTPDLAGVVAAHSDLEAVGGGIFNHRALVFDATNPALRDPRVRRAIAVAIDREAIVQSLYGGQVAASATFQHRAFGALNDPARSGAAYDPDLARRLLREAGYARAPIAYRLVPNYYTLQMQTAQVLLEMWRAVGLNIELQTFESWTNVLAPAGRGIFDYSNNIIWNDPTGSLWRLWGSGSPIQTVYRAWSNDAFNRLGAALEIEEDAAERRRIFQAMLDIVELADPPGTILHDSLMLYGKRRALRWTPGFEAGMDFGPGNLAFAG